MRQNAGEYLETATPANTYGLTVAPNTHESALPVTTHGAHDMGGNPFHPDSPVFWVLAFVGLTLVGIVGVTAGGRVGPAKASLQLGDL